MKAARLLMAAMRAPRAPGLRLFRAEGPSGRPAGARAPPSLPVCDRALHVCGAAAPAMALRATRAPAAGNARALATGMRATPRAMAAGSGEEEGKSLLRETLDAEIEYEEASEEAREIGFAHVERLMDEYGFEIEDEEGVEEIVLTKKYKNEEITVLLKFEEVEPVDDPEELINKYEGNKYDDDDDEEPFTSDSAVATVCVKKGSTELQFDIGFSRDGEIPSISRIAFINPTAGLDADPYQGPDFETLDERLQDALLDYLEERGFTGDCLTLLVDLASEKEASEYLQWLKQLRSFISE